MPKKPSDLLDFLRQSGQEPPGEPAPAPAPAEPELERSTPMLVLRRTQVIVAGGVAGVLLILIFLLGLALGGSGESEPASPAAAGIGVWGIRVVSYNDTEKGRVDAAITRNQLKDLDLDEVTVHRIRSQGLLVVMLGSWLHEPSKDPKAGELLSKVKNLQTRGKNRAFPDAHFWRIQR